MSNQTTNLVFQTIDDPNNFDEMVSIYDLVKLSSCTHWMEKYENKERLKIISFTDRQLGKWYFQPDQRCDVVQQFINEDPRIARDVLPYKEWLVKSCGEILQEMEVK